MIEKSSSAQTRKNILNHKIVAGMDAHEQREVEIRTTTMGPKALEEMLSELNEDLKNQQ